VFWRCAPQNSSTVSPPAPAMASTLSRKLALKTPLSTATSVSQQN
jgi:hypothetical protein